MGKLTKLIKTTGWITVGITAIAVEQTVKAGKHIHNEVKSGRPQDLVRKHCKSIKDKMSLLNNVVKIPTYTTKLWKNCKALQICLNLAQIKRRDLTI